MLSGANAFEVSQRQSAILPLYGASGACASHKGPGIDHPSALLSLTCRSESHLAIEHVPLAQAALLKKFGKSDVYDFFAEIRLSAWADFADNRPIVGTEFGTMVGTAETAPDASASRLKCAGETT